MSKVLVGANVPSRLVVTKISLVILIFVKPSTCWDLGVLLRNNMLVGALRSCVVMCVIGLLTCAYSRLATGLSCLCFTSAKVFTVFGLFVLYRLISLHASQPIVEPRVLNDPR